MNDLWIIENNLRCQGYNVLCGVDEAGRGPLAGPVCAAAVILPENCVLNGLNDSKKLSAKKRESLFQEICNHAISYGIAFASVDEIESLNILNASLLAMNRAMHELDMDFDLAIIDGNQNRGLDFHTMTIVSGDSKCASIAAASILAKVTRDRYMCDLALKYPGYGFEQHKGYGTKAHYDALRRLGPCEAHRQSFLRKMHA